MSKNQNIIIVFVITNASAALMGKFQLILSFNCPATGNINHQYQVCDQLNAAADRACPSFSRLMYAINFAGIGETAAVVAIPPNQRKILIWGESIELIYSRVFS
jgi:hypothetical protein